MRKAQRGNRPDCIACYLKYFIFSRHRDTRDSQVGAQLAPGDLSRTGNQGQEEIILLYSKQDAADDLSGICPRSRAACSNDSGGC